ncbi:MAG: molybdenum cofactor biosynthesis protein MoaE [Armatimonadetes bacterium]|nr:molybdenum cofactor biosynthesis protein MoaE [Armatimonadota bacterium]
MVEIVDRPIELDPLIEWARQDSDGAVVTFLGTVRDFAEGRAVVGMEYSCYTELALKELQALEAEVSRRWPVGRIALVHRVGPMTLGEVSVAIVVASPHRAEAFDACRYAIDTLKQTVPIWKKEHFQEEPSAWVRGVAGKPVQDISGEQD